MKGENQSTSEEQFQIEGFSDFPKLQVPLFILFLVMYLFTLVGNILIMIIIYSNSHLHTPMYFFISNLSFIDICYTSVIFPLMLTSFFQEVTHVSLKQCLLQMYFFIFLVATEFLLLTVMAYDRYVAICNPLHYMTVMNKAVCFWMAAGSWIGGLLDPLPHTILMAGLSYCDSHKIRHFFCDVTAMMKLSCTSTRSVEAASYIVGVIVAMTSFILIIASYVNIISSILKIKSNAGRRKAFSTCSSHLFVVILFSLSICSTYMRPTSTYSMRDTKILSLLYTIITPLCNPIIYSLKNADFKSALRKCNMRL